MLLVLPVKFFAWKWQNNRVCNPVNGWFVQENVKHSDALMMLEIISVCQRVCVMLGKTMGKLYLPGRGGIYGYIAL